MKIIATLACRNNSSRLYGKPMQNLMSVSVLQYMIERLRERPEIDDIVLAISEEKANLVFVEEAERIGVKYILGDDRDVLSRLIKACECGGGDTVYRVTTESPFTILEKLPEAVDSHRENRADYTMYPNLPDGSTFELVSLAALKKSHAEGDSRHRSELCCLYINQNPGKFKMNILRIEPEWERPDYRITIDYPEDLIQCRRIVAHFGGDDKYIPYKPLVKFLDENPDLVELVNNLSEKNKITRHNPIA